MSKIGQGLATCGIWLAVAYMIGSGHVPDVEKAVVPAAVATILLWIFS